MTELERLQAMIQKGAQDTDESFVAPDNAPLTTDQQLQLGGRMLANLDVVLAVLEVARNVAQGLALEAGMNGITTGPVAIQAIKRLEKQVLDLTRKTIRYAARTDTGDRR